MSVSEKSRRVLFGCPLQGVPVLEGARLLVSTRDGLASALDESSLLDSGDGSPWLL